MQWTTPKLSRSEQKLFSNYCSWVYSLAGKFWSSRLDLFICPQSAADPVWPQSESGTIWICCMGFSHSSSGLAYLMDMQGSKSRGARVSRRKCASIFHVSVCNMSANIPLGKSWHGLAQSPEMKQNTLPTMGEVMRSINAINLSQVNFRSEVEERKPGFAG